MCQLTAKRNIWASYRMRPSQTVTHPKPKGRKSAIIYWAYRVRSSSSLITIVVMTLFCMQLRIVTVRPSNVIFTPWFLFGYLQCQVVYHFHNIRHTRRTYIKISWSWISILQLKTFGHHHQLMLDGFGCVSLLNSCETHDFFCVLFFCLFHSRSARRIAFLLPDARKKLSGKDKAHC